MARVTGNLAGMFGLESVSCGRAGARSPATTQPSTVLDSRIVAQDMPGEPPSRGSPDRFRTAVHDRRDAAGQPLMEVPQRALPVERVLIVPSLDRRVPKPQVILEDFGSRTGLLASLVTRDSTSTLAPGGRDCRQERSRADLDHLIAGRHHGFPHLFARDRLDDTSATKPPFIGILLGAYHHARPGGRVDDREETEGSPLGARRTHARMSYYGSHR